MWSKLKKIAYNNKEYLWALIGRFLPQIVYFITTMVLARLLTPNDFGTVGVLSIFFYLAGVLMDSGLGGSLIKEKYIEPIDCSTIFTFNLFVSIFLYIVMFVAAPYIEHYFDMPGLCGVTRTLSLIFIINAFGIVQNSILVKKLLFKNISYALIISTIVASIVSVLIAFFFKSVYAIVVYQLIQAAIAVFLYNYYCRTVLHIRFSFASLKKLLPFGLSTTFSSFLDTIYENLISVILGKYSGAAVVGYFSQAKRIEEVPSKSVVQTISNTSFPILVKYIDNASKLDEESMRVFRYSSLLLIPVFGVIFCFSDIIIALLFGDQWIEASPFLQLLSIAGGFLFIDTMYRGFIKSANQPRLLLKSTFIKRVLGISIILMAALFLPSRIMYAYILSSALASIISIFYYSRIIDVPFVWYLLKNCEVLALSFIPVFLIVGCGLIFNSLLIEILTCFIVLGLYYSIILRMKK